MHTSGTKYFFHKDTNVFYPNNIIFECIFLITIETSFISFYLFYHFMFTFHVLTESDFRVSWTKHQLSYILCAIDDRNSFWLHIIEEEEYYFKFFIDFSIVVLNRIYKIVSVYDHKSATAVGFPVSSFVFAQKSLFL